MFDYDAVLDTPRHPALAYNNAYLQYEEIFHKKRDGFYGWMGHGGSVFQWHPELKISFAYVPTDFYLLDGCINRAGNMQKLAKELVEGLK